MFPLAFLSLFLVIGNFSPFSIAASNCPLYGPLFPIPQKASTSASVQDAIEGLKAVFGPLDGYYGKNNSYSIQVFSSSETLFEYYHTAPTLPTLRPSGVEQVDGDTVYRIGSITKIFTMYAFLLGGGAKYFSQPITEFVPELAAQAGSAYGNAVTKVDWADITIGDLASHLAGIASDSYVGDIALTEGVSKAMTEGFPPLAFGETPNCGFYPTCTRQQFFNNFARYHPGVAIAETPVYSNVAFQILSYAMETITGKKFTDSLDNSVLTPLNLSRTYYDTPDTSVGVIPGLLSATQWSYDMNIEGPAGIIYSSVNDLTKLGQSILGHKLLTPLQTRRWLKPATLTSDIRETVGYPWGIRRITLNDSQPYNILTTYNKGGNIGSYASDLTLIPELDIGFAVLIAGDLTVSSLGLATVLGTYLLPALVETARDQATTLYGGTYRNDPAGLWQITITTNSTKPGLGISNWFNNGKNMLEAIEKIVQKTSVVSPTFEARLYPTDLQGFDAYGNKLVTFKAIWEDLAYQPPDTLLAAACGTWIGPTGIIYGSQALDEFIFTINPSGKVISVLNSGVRTTLNKT